MSGRNCLALLASHQRTGYVQNASKMLLPRTKAGAGGNEAFNTDRVMIVRMLVSLNVVKSNPERGGELEKTFQHTAVDCFRFVQKKM